MKRNKVFNLILIYTVLITFAFPVLVLAQPTTTPPPTTYGTYNTTEGLVVCNGPDCTFDHIYQLINRLKDFALLYLMIPLAVISIAFAGFKYVMAQGNASEITKAHNIFYYTIGGIVLALGAWLIVSTILTVLGVEDAYNFLK